MVSYKKLYMDLKATIEQNSKSYESDYNCPLCESVLLQSNSELYCSNDSCKYDITFDKLIQVFAESRNLDKWRVY